jgi:hypothetical protein
LRYHFFSTVVNMFLVMRVDLEHAWRCAGHFTIYRRFSSLGLLYEPGFTLLSVCLSLPSLLFPLSTLPSSFFLQRVSAPRWRTTRCAHDNGGYIVIRYRYLGHDLWIWRLGTRKIMNAMMGEFLMNLELEVRKCRLGLHDHYRYPFLRRRGTKRASV